MEQQTQRSQSVREAWDMTCPSCKQDHSLDITATVCVRLTPDGTDADAAQQGGAEWTDDSDVTCAACSWTGTVRDAEIKILNEAQTEREFAFDVKLFATIRVKAKSEAEARNLLKQHVDAAEANFGAWPNGDPITGEASVDDDHPELIEINGEAV